MSILRLTDLDLRGKRVLIRQGESASDRPWMAGPDDPKLLLSRHGWWLPSTLTSAKN